VRRLLLAALLLAAAPAVAADTTTVRFSESRAVRRLPDEFYAVARVEARSASAAAAQDAVNRAVAAAIGAAKGVAGVNVATGRYTVYRGGEPRVSPPWQASQEVTLRTTDAAAGTALLAAWQEQGLAVSQIGWRLTPPLAQSMHDEATRLVLTALEQRLALVAAQMRLTADGFSVVSLDGVEEFEPRGYGIGASALAARAAAPPVAVAEELSVTVRASAEAILRRP